MRDTGGGRTTHEDRSLFDSTKRSAHPRVQSLRQRRADNKNEQIEILAEGIAYP